MRMRPFIRRALLVLAALVGVSTLGAFAYTVSSTRHIARLCSLLLVYDMAAGLLLISLLAGWTAFYVRSKAKGGREALNASYRPMPDDDDDGGDNDDDSSADEVDLPAAGAAGALNDAEARPGQGADGKGKRSCASVAGLVFSVTLSVVVVAAVWTVFGVVLYLQQSTVPDVGGSVRASGLRAEVWVRRDRSGVIHVDAENEHDMYFAQGYATAQERLWQLEFQRRVVTGTLAAAVGSAAVATDILMRTLGLHRVMERNLEGASAEVTAALQAYTDGVNAFVATGPQTLEFFVLGLSPRPFAVSELAAWSKVMSLDLSLNAGDELKRYRLLTERNLTEARIAELVPSYDSAAFPTVLSDADVAGIPFPPTSGGGGGGGGDDSPAAPVLRWLAARRAREPGFDARVDPGRWAANARLFGRDAFSNTRASNNWVVSGSLTESGHPLLANDPHLQFMAPSIWILFSLRAPGHAAVGASFAGLPMIVLGRNERVAWGITNVGADVQDLYLMDEVNSTHYRHRGAEVAYAVRREHISVGMGGSDVEVRVRSSVYGPVVTDTLLATKPLGPAGGSAGVPASLRWVSLDEEDRSLDGFYGVNRARNWTEFVGALDGFRAPVSNMVYADVDGNIGYTMPGLVPRRFANHSGTYPVPGTGEYDDWLPGAGADRFVPYELMPRVLNPAEGFVASANNRVTPDSWPEAYAIARDWDAGSTGYRARRIVDVLRAGGRGITAADMLALQNDYASGLAADFDGVLRSLPEGSLSAAGRRWRDRLLAWDGVEAAGAPEPTVFAAWYGGLARVARHETGKDYWVDHRFLLRAFNTTAGDPACAPHCAEFAAAALNEAAAGSKPDWGRGRTHQALFKHQILGETPLACLANRHCDKGGGLTTVNVGGFNFSSSARTNTHGPSYRQVVDLGDMEASVFMNPLGQSGNQFARTYDNLLEPWARGDYLEMRTTAPRTPSSSQRLEPAR